MQFAHSIHRVALEADRLLPLSYASCAAKAFLYVCRENCYTAPMKKFLAPIVVVAIILAMLLLVFSGDPKDTRTYGPVDTEGVLTGTGISLIRKGTHVLSIDGEPTYYIESTEHNLRTFEGHRVHIVGISEPNVRVEYLPLLRISTIEDLEDPVTVSTVRISQFDLEMALPDTWDSTFSNATARFSVDGQIIVRIARTTVDDRENIDGVPVRIGGRSGIRLSSPSEGALQEYIVFPDDTSALRITFAPSVENERLPLLTTQFTDALQSARFTDRQQSSTPSTGTGSAVQCGGAAGILCPAGFYCDVFDPEIGLGNCKPL